MTRADFNLIDEKWIPVVDLEARPRLLGLAEALGQAHQLVAIQHESPLVTAAVYRLALAIVHRAVGGPRGLDEWTDLWEQGRIPGSALADYLGRWRHRFDLFCSERPFMQDPSLENSADRVTISAMVLDRAIGATLFDHTHVNRAAPLSPGEAACHLLAYNGFAAGGRIFNEKNSWRQGLLRKGGVVLLRGANLFETLLLNLLVYDPAQAKPVPGTTEDAPSWERDLPIEWSGTRVPHGWLDMLTVQARRMLLFRDDGGRVSACAIAGGESLTPDLPQEPLMAWRQSKTAGMLPLPISTDRAVWRDSHALILGRDAGIERPRNIEQAAHLIRAGTVPPQYRLHVDVHGAATRKAVILTWRTETLPVPPALLADEDRAELVGRLTALAAGCGEALSVATDTMAKIVLSQTADLPEGRRPARVDIGQLAASSQIMARFWLDAGRGFPDAVAGLACDSPSAVAHWWKTLERAAWRAFNQGCEGFETGAAGYKAAARGRLELSRRLAALRPEVEEESHQ